MTFIDGRRHPLAALRYIASALGSLAVAACGGSSDSAPQGDAAPSFLDAGTPEAGALTGCSCTDDFRAIRDCEGRVIGVCDPLDVCDGTTHQCANACAETEALHRSVGCEYYATEMSNYLGAGACFAAIIANTWTETVRFSVEFEGLNLPLQNFTWLPRGTGLSLRYEQYDPKLGLAPGDTAVIFLGGDTSTGFGWRKGDQDNGDSPGVCPMASAVLDLGMVGGTAIGNSFRIKTDAPIVAYQMNPYGAATAATTGASLLIPTSAWGKQYIGAAPLGYGIVGYGASAGDQFKPSINIVASEDDTQITLQARTAVVGGNGLPGGPAGSPLSFTLQRGQQAQFLQFEELTGSIITSNKPIGLLGGSNCMNIPLDTGNCDHAEQMIPAVKSIGSEYVNVMYRSRWGEDAFWRIYGIVDGTELTYSSDVNGVPTLDQGETWTFQTGTPFTVKSQDSEHPFLIFGYMSGGSWVQDSRVPTTRSNHYQEGDPDFVMTVPVNQYLSSYVFYADQTYPETNLVLARGKQDGTFHDVFLDCLDQPVSGWQSLGDYEWTRVDLSTGFFEPVNGCSTGTHQMHSDAPFGLTVWGWGTTHTGTGRVSYAFPGGMDVKPINNVTLGPIVP